MSRLTLRLPDSLHQQLEQMAESEQISLNQYIVYALTRQLTLAYNVQAVPEKVVAEERAAYSALLQSLGRASFDEIQQALAARGAVIAANDISPLNVEAVVGEINAAEGTARAYIHDVAKKVAVQAMVNDVVDEFARLDVLINCANVQPPAGLLELDEWDLHRVFEVNAIGVFLMMQSVGRVMRKQGHGLILNLVKLPDDAPASFLASQGGIAALSERADRELMPHGIRVVAVTEADPVEAVLGLLENA